MGPAVFHYAKIPKKLLIVQWDIPIKENSIKECLSKRSVGSAAGVSVLLRSIGILGPIRECSNHKSYQGMFQESF